MLSSDSVNEVEGGKSERATKKQPNVHFRAFLINMYKGFAIECLVRQTHTQNKSHTQIKYNLI